MTLQSGLPSNVIVYVDDVTAGRWQNDLLDITRTIRGIASEVEVGPEHGLSDRAVINCDNIITIPKADLDPEAVGRIDMGTRAVLDRALRYSLDIIY